MCNNGSCGLYVESKASICSVLNFVVHENVKAGIYSEHSKSVFIRRNNVFDNDWIGLHIVNSHVEISENNIFDNGSWAISTQYSSRLEEFVLDI